MTARLRPYRLVLLALVAAAIMLPRAGGAGTSPRPAGEFTQQADVGRVERPGSAEYDAARQAYRVTGSGENVWGKSDAFYFLSRPAAGDVVLGFDVAFEGEGKNAHRKACGMVRQGPEPDAAYVDVAVHGDGLISLQFRREKGGVTEEMKSSLKGPATVRLERRGDTFTLFVKPAGGKEAAVGPLTLALKDPVRVGLAVCSHEAARPETATFSHVVLKADPPRAERH